MVFCRGCGKDILETATLCSLCGASQLVQAEPKKRSIGKLIAWSLVWTSVFWVGSLIITGIVAGVLNPQNAQEAGAKAGEALSGTFLLLSLVTSITLTSLGKLPGTSKK